VIYNCRNLGGLEPSHHLVPATRDQLLTIRSQKLVEHVRMVLSRFSGVCALPHIARRSYRAKEYPDLFCLARYIASSALLTSVSAVVPFFGKIEIPMLAPILGLILRSRTLTLQGT
jgi:hypothetical protein